MGGRKGRVVAGERVDVEAVGPMEVVGEGRREVLHAVEVVVGTNARTVCGVGSQLTHRERPIKLASWVRAGPLGRVGLGWGR